MTALITLLLLASPKQVAPSPTPFRWDVPKVVAEIDVPAVMETNGIPSRMHVVMSAVPAEELFAHFLRAFSAAGLYIPPPEEQLRLEGQYMLTAFDPDSETSYSVILQPFPNGRTGVVLGEAYLKGRKFGAVPDIAPVFPGAVGKITTRLEGAEHLSYSVQARPEEVLEFYEETLRHSGFKVSVYARPGLKQAWTEVIVSKERRR